MTGHLHLVFAEGGGRTFVREQSFRAPVHLSKPHWDGNHLIVNAVNPTAGLFSGDVVEVSVHAAENARGVLTSPSASRVYQARHGAPATLLRQKITVAAGAWLELIPELLIPQAGARFVQETHLDVQSGGRALLIDSMAPGRVASGEVFAFESLCWTTRIALAGRLAALERFRLSPADDSLHALRQHFPGSYHATGFLVAPPSTADAALRRGVAALSAQDVLAGASSPCKGVTVFKILAADSLALRRTLSRLRSMVYQAGELPAPDLRKL